MFIDSNSIGIHPRPQFVRTNRWWSLDGPWEFQFDDDNVGLRDRWYRQADFKQRLIVPFPPESQDSGIADDGDHAALWYRRNFAIPRELNADRLLLHFGAVDYSADVWVDGQHAGSHQGGQTPFYFDVTDLLDETLPPDCHVIVVRVEDDRTNLEQPRGKQDWLPQQHVIWYHRTSGVWRTVWLERVPLTHFAEIRYRADVAEGRLHCQIRTDNIKLIPSARIRVEAFHHDGLIGDAEVSVAGPLADITVPLSAQRNGPMYEELLWSPDSPVLLTTKITLLDSGGTFIDQVDSYCGLRSVTVSGDELLLNDRPFRMRGVLEQGYWPTSHLTPPSVAALRSEVELIKALGFNTVRIHQKVEDPRFLFWCDVLGLAVWSETAAAYSFTDQAIANLTAEWVDLVRGNSAHPCIIAWVPFNESWGVPHIAQSAAQQSFVNALTALTRALDPTRPVVSNDGWEHTDSDLLTVHDYTQSGPELAARYANNAALVVALAGISPGDRRKWVHGKMPPVGEIPVLLAEFGGVSFNPKEQHGSWGYSTASSAAEYESRLADLAAGVHAAAGLRGFCYTQLTDTGLETNGLCDADRCPKLPIEALRRIFAAA